MIFVPGFFQLKRASTSLLAVRTYCMVKSQNTKVPHADTRTWCLVMGNASKPGVGTTGFESLGIWDSC